MLMSGHVTVGACASDSRACRCPDEGGEPCLLSWKWSDWRLALFYAFFLFVRVSPFASQRRASVTRSK